VSNGVGAQAPGDCTENSPVLEKLLQDSTTPPVDMFPEDNKGGGWAERVDEGSHPIPFGFHRPHPQGCVCLCVGGCVGGVYTHTWVAFCTRVYRKIHCHCFDLL
jgi:hypothetical protein